MVRKKELHHTTTGYSGPLRLCEHFEIWTHVGSTRCDWLWRAFNFNEAHAAVASNRESLMVAESRNFDASFLAGLENGV